MKAALRKVASALSFAHLAGIGNNARAESEDDKDKKDPAERNHEDQSASGKSDVPGDNDKDYPVQAEGESDEDYAQRCDQYEKDKDAKQAKSRADDDADAGKEDDEDKEDKEVEMRGNSPCAEARRREQARCAAIFASAAAAKNPTLAANLAFKTRMTRSEALAVLEGTPAPAAAGNPGRAARNPNVGAGASGAVNSPQAVAKNWDTAFAKANPRSATRH